MILQAWAISNATLKELLRGKLLYSVIFFALIMFFAATLFGSVSVGEVQYVIKGLGLSGITLSVNFFIVITTTLLLEKEIKNKTILNIFSKPVSRSSYLLGKLLGVFIAASLLISICACLLFCWIYFLAGSPPFEIFEGVFYTLCESLLLCGVAIFFSSIFTVPIISGFATFFIWIIGRSLELLLVLGEKMQDPGKSILEIMYWALPGFFRFEVSSSIIYGESLGLARAFYTGVYAVSLTMILVLLGSMVFEKRQFR